MRDNVRLPAPAFPHQGDDIRLLSCSSSETWSTAAMREGLKPVPGTAYSLVT